MNQPQPPRYTNHLNGAGAPIYGVPTWNQAVPLRAVPDIGPPPWEQTHSPRLMQNGIPIPPPVHYNVTPHFSVIASTLPLPTRASGAAAITGRQQPIWGPMHDNGAPVAPPYVDSESGDSHKPYPHPVRSANHIPTPANWGHCNPPPPGWAPQQNGNPFPPGWPLQQAHIPDQRLPPRILQPARPHRSKKRSRRRSYHSPAVVAVAAPLPAPVYSPYQTPIVTTAFLQGDGNSWSNLAPRPKDWRPGYSPEKGKIGKYIDRLWYPTDRNCAIYPAAKMHPLILFKHIDKFPIIHDLREEPFNPVWPVIPGVRDANYIDMSQFASDPPRDSVRFWHKRLPWLIDIHTSSPSGITIGDVLQQLYKQLMVPIRSRDFYNTEMTSDYREAITSAYSERCAGDMEKLQKGICRIDYLGYACMFIGLAKSRHGWWEIKTTGKIDEGVTMT